VSVINPLFVSGLEFLMVQKAGMEQVKSSS